MDEERRGYECVLYTYCNFVGERGRGSDSPGFFLPPFSPALLVFVFNLAVQQTCPAG